MTYFLPQMDRPPEIAANNPSVDIPHFWGGVGAAFSRAAIENNANFRMGRERGAVQRELARSVMDRVGIDGIVDYVERTGPGFDHIRQKPTTIDGLLQEYGDEATGWILGAAREGAEADPASWADVDLTDQGIEDTVNSRLRKEYDALSEEIALLPTGSGSANLLGSMLGISLDVKNIPFMLMGGGAGGGILRTAAREAAINVAAETVALPDQFRVARRLGIPEPRIASHLAQAAAFGAAFGGATSALGRGMEWQRRRSQIKDLEDAFAEMRYQKSVDAVERAFTESVDDPIAAASRALDEIQTTQLPDQQIDPEDFFANRPPDAQTIDEAAQHEQFVQQEWKDIIAESPEMRYKYPLTQLIISRGGVRYKITRGGHEVLSPVAQELANMGITPKTHPFIWRKTGMTDLDNLPASEFDRLSEVIATDRETGYFEPDALIQAMGDELTGGRKTPMNADMAARMDVMDAGPSPSRAADAPVGSEPNLFDDGYEFRPKDYQEKFGESAQSQMADDIHSYIAQRGYDRLLTDEEMSAITDSIAKTGGAVDDHLDRMADDILDRQSALTKAQEASYAEVPIESPIPRRGNEPAGQAQVGPGGQAAERSVPANGGPQGSGARAGTSGAPVFEKTAAGQQRVIPGVEPISQRERLEAAQAAPLRGGNAPADNGLFDVSGRSQRDMLDDLASPQSKAVHADIETGLRDGIETDGDFSFDMGDGKGVRSASRIMDEADQFQEFVDAIDLCGRRG